MLKPHKHADPSLSVVNVAGLIIAALHKNTILAYDDLLAILTDQASAGVKEVYHYALSFLYLVGKIEYISEIDALRMTG